MKSTNAKSDIYQDVTNTIIAAFETCEEWQRPWATASCNERPCRANGEHYQGVNVVILWAMAYERGYHSKFWLTFKQAKALGGSVRKGEKGSPVVYYSTFEKEATDAKTGEEFNQKIPFLKRYCVFNADQVDGLPEHMQADKPNLGDPVAAIVRADKFFRRLGADIRHGGNRACYFPTEDYVQMPDRAQFFKPDGYYSTLAHELTHWTGAVSRCDRRTERAGISGPVATKRAYAFEELIAELGAAFLCADLGIAPNVREDHAPYIKSWLKALKDDKRFIFRAAAQAEKATTYMKDRQPKEASEPLELTELAAPQSAPPRPQMARSEKAIRARMKAWGISAWYPRTRTAHAREGKRADRYISANALTDIPLTNYLGQPVVLDRNTAA